MTPDPARSLTIARHELRTQLASPLVWALLLIAVLLTLSLNTAPMISRGGSNPGAARLFNNTPYTLAFVFGILGFMVYGFFSSLIAGLTVIRDDESRVAELLHSTPLTRGEYALGKCGGVMAALALVLSLHVVFAMLFFQFGPLDENLARGPFRPAAFLVPALMFTAPQIWLFGGLAFAVGAWTRKPMVVFVVPTALFMIILTLGLQSLLSATETGVDRWLMIFEPSGLRWLFRTRFLVDRGVEFYNTAPLWPDGTLLLNRLVTCAWPALAVVVSVRHCGTSAGSRGAGKRGMPEAPPAPSHAAPAARVPLADLRMRSSAPGFRSSLRHIAGAELRELGSQPGVYLFAALILGLVADGATSAVGPFGAPSILTAGNIAVGSLGSLTLLFCLVLMFYTVESFQRDRATRFDAIFLAAPFRTAALLLARNLAGAVLVAAILTAATLVGLSLLWLQDQGRIEVWPFALVWGLVLTPTLLLWSAFITFVVSIFRGRYLTYAVGFAALLGTFVNLRREWMSWPLNWTLVGTLRWSDMGTFALNGRPLVLNRLLAVAVAIFLLAVATRVFARVDRDADRTRARLRPAALGASALRLAPYAVPALALGGVLAYQVHTGFQGPAAEVRAHDYRRLNRAAWSGSRTALVTHVELDIDLEPAARSMTVAGAYDMVNPYSEPLPRLPFTIGPAAEEVRWTVNDAPIQAEDRSGLQLLEPAIPLAPGASVRVGFAYRAVHPRGFTKNGGGIPQFILPSGVALHTLRDSFLPVPGFVESMGGDRDQRSVEVGAGPQRGSAADPPPFTARISVTAPDAYTVNSVGRRSSHGTEDGRTTVVWETDYPVGAINIVAGRWEVRRRGDTAVFFHPGHDHNVEEILATLVAARERYSEWFHPYPWAELRLSEFPDLVMNAQGFPTNIPFSEGIGFLTRSEPGTRLPFLVTSHEAAHQWWGNLVSAAEGPGTGHLVEGLAHYSALLLHESELGLEARIEFAKAMEANYGRVRRVDSELPLAEMVDDTSPADWSVVYEKGAWVQWMLQEHLGREPALAGIRQFVRHRVAERKRPVLQDLIDVLRSVAVDVEAFDEFVDQWFFDVVVPEYRIAEAAVARSGDRWHVRATIANVGTGVASVQVAATRGRRFPDDTGEDVGGSYTEARTAVRIEPGVPAVISLVADFEPEHLIVDPDAQVLQLNRGQAQVDLAPGPHSRFSRSK